MQTNFIAEAQLGYAQILAAALATPQALTIPAGTVLILVTPEVQSVRWRADGTAPTATVGYPLSVGSEARFTLKQMAALQFIAQTAGAILNVYFFGQ